LSFKIGDDVIVKPGEYMLSGHQPSEGALDFFNIYVKEEVPGKIVEEREDAYRIEFFGFWKGSWDDHKIWFDKKKIFLFLKEASFEF
jgi:hypothetical protein